jgi:hypothetical protein
VHACADDGTVSERLSLVLTKQADDFVAAEKQEQQEARPVRLRDGAPSSSSFSYEEEKPRYWTKYSSSKLNEPVEGEGLDLEAERTLHEAHEKHATICLSGGGGKSLNAAAALSPGSGVAAAMARLGRESLSMAD